jgi:hypothetical protein
MGNAIGICSVEGLGSIFWAATPGRRRKKAGSLRRHLRGAANVTHLGPKNIRAGALGKSRGSKLQDEGREKLSLQL